MHTLTMRFKHALSVARVKRWLVAGALLSILFTAGCGKRKPPLPPTERVLQVVDIGGFQLGPQIELEWRMPARNAPDGSTLNISRVDIYRLAEPLGAPLSLTEAEFSARSNLIASIPVTDADFGLKTKSYSDPLRFAGQQARLRYAVRFVNASGQKAAFSNFFLIEPTAKVALRPAGPAAIVGQEEITLTWNAPDSNVDGSKPPNILGYNIYRTVEGDQTPAKINEQPVGDTRYEDNLFEFEKQYRYFIRSVSLGRDAVPVESVSSEVIEVLPKDTFPPAAPGAITIAAAPNSISIFFATNVEKDLAGYRVYRSTDPAIAKANWQLLTPEILETNTFRDTKVEPGKIYYYYLTATDTFGNVSEPSTVVSETAL